MGIECCVCVWWLHRQCGTWYLSTQEAINYGRWTVCSVSTADVLHFNTSEELRSTRTHRNHIIRRPTNAQVDTLTQFDILVVGQNEYDVGFAILCCASTAGWHFASKIARTCTIAGATVIACGANPPLGMDAGRRRQCRRHQHEECKHKADGRNGPPHDASGVRYVVVQHFHTTTEQQQQKRIELERVCWVCTNDDTLHARMLHTRQMLR